MEYEQYAKVQRGTGANFFVATAKHMHTLLKLEWLCFVCVYSFFFSFVIFTRYHNPYCIEKYTHTHTQVNGGKRTVEPTRQLTMCVFLY